MTGFALSSEEIVSVCQRMRGPIEAMRDRTAPPTTDALGPGDFGGTEQDDLAELYREVVTELIPAKLREFEQSVATMSTDVESALRAYQDMDERIAADISALFHEEASTA
ncbi:hypothetical protein EV191_113108 [Tamaricihabitans halophyticus]|uniref:Excreted virulence factor EspC (Type VII ESX diderm) n=1 Tax=Tamaricihabitans halophyticus TaxID=1262583 RepID=A0A4R2QIM4_9PSEU|nr:hypothetical protein [Tamaricihabitans halophyticus]TCP46831.1 hypothetical protein EV191_113108 [Tamaricihabitans halophyticus]